MIAQIQAPPCTSLFTPLFPSAEDKIEELKRTVSASRLSAWHRCRLQFFFHYVKGIQKPPSPALHTGSVVHLVLQAWNKGRWRGTPLELPALKTLFDTRWQVLQAGVTVDWDGTEKEQQESAWRTLEAYFRETPIKTEEKPEAVEVQVEADLVAHGLPVLIGFIDLVRAGGRIVDYKTAAKTPEPERAIHQHELQMSCYAVLYRESTGKRERDLELHHLVKTKVPRILVTSLGPMTQVQEARLFRLMESYVEGLDRKDFVPSPGLGCLACDYFAECRAWSGRRAYA